MADNIAITPGTGATIAADDIGGVHYQRIKLSLGADGTANDASAGVGAVGTGTQRVTLASDDPAVTKLNSLGNTVHRAVTFSLNTSAYTASDLLAETQQIDGFFRVADGTGIIQSITLYDQDDQGVPMTIYFLDANVSMGTENSAPSISDANALNILGWVDVLTGDWKDIGGVRVASIRNVGLPVKAASGTDDLYIAIVNGTGTPTFTASGLKASIGALLD
jgi:hypothetical protein